MRKEVENLKASHNVATIWQRKQKDEYTTCPNLLRLMVETRGVEPLTSAMPLQRSAKLSYVPWNGWRTTNYKLRDTNEQMLDPRLAIGNCSFELILPSRENGFAFFEECGDAFPFVFSREAYSKEIDLATEAFVEV